ncbi:hypothetical protein BC834DRAFT_867911 [Gloeopeniophorella convolvens]|nr:hypothetical protein BC834DRAFT_867911 [Gloeopeniophorella convolvens]
MHPQVPPRRGPASSPHTEESPNWALAPDRKAASAAKSKPKSKRQGEAKFDVKAAHPRAKSRRGRGRGRSAGVQGQEDAENLPPPAEPKSNAPPHRRRGRQVSSQDQPKNKPGPRHTRPNGADGMTITSCDAQSVSNRLLNERGQENMTPVNSHDDPTRGRRRSRSRGGSRSKAQLDSKRPVRSRSRADAGIAVGVSRSRSRHQVVSIIEEDVKMSNLKTPERPAVESVPVAPVTPIVKDGLGPASPHSDLEVPVSASDANVSTVQPLPEPSSTRRRAKEYFQRRTRERSVDADTKRQIQDQRSASATAAVTKHKTRGRPQARGSGLDLGEVLRGQNRKPTSGSTTQYTEDSFAFDPDASSFTPNATSSPKQASLSSIGAQSFSSPTPAPLHGNRRVASLVLGRSSSNTNTPMEATYTESPPQSIPVTIQTTHGVRDAQELAYAYAQANRTQAQLEAQTQHLALLQLQAHYHWLAGTLPAAGIGAGEHMDLSGGAGGLSGGVALGLQLQAQLAQGSTGRSHGVQGRGRAQSRNTSGAYAHPKEHIVFSPHEHERLLNRTIPGAEEPAPQARGPDGHVKPGKDGADTSEAGGRAQGAAQKWNGHWGLREGQPRTEIGWTWGATGTVGLGMEMM